jgi:hypothetical protein
MVVSFFYACTSRQVNELRKRLTSAMTAKNASPLRQGSKAFFPLDWKERSNVTLLNTIA